MPTTPAVLTVDSARKELLALLRHADLLGSAGALLEWDGAVNLPDGAADLRGEQQESLALAIHAVETSPRLGELLDFLEKSGAAATDPDLAAILHFAREDYDGNLALPAEFSAEQAGARSRGYAVWEDARERSDFGAFVPVITRNLDLARQEARYLDAADAPLSHLIDTNAPGVDLATADRLLAEMRRDLVPLVREVLSLPHLPRARAVAASLKGFPVDRQRVFLQEAVQALGFDLSRGRIDVSPHPFATGVADDVRLTVSFDEDKPLDALYSALHEAGHGIYDQGLRRELMGSALGADAGMGIHESQSRFYENQVGRSRGFWRQFFPRWVELFPRQMKGVSFEDFFRALHVVTPSLIRTEADEVTYNLHALIRFEIEKRLFAGELSPEGIPQVWSDLSFEMLGIRPLSDRDGGLQDPHWADGSFGYFPSYPIGNMVAAQLWFHLRRQRPALDEEFARGEFGGVLAWMREHIHAHGRRYGTLELVRRATGEDLSPRYLLADLRERYTAALG